MDYGPNQTVDPGNQEKKIETPWHRGQAWVVKSGEAYKTLQYTQPLQFRGMSCGAKKRTHRPHSGPVR